MQDIHCRYCDYYLCSVAAKEGKIRITCKKCKRNQLLDVSTKVIAPSHLQAAGL